MRGLRERLRDQAEVLSVDVRSPAGQRLVERHGLHPFQMAVFDRRGNLAETVTGHDEAGVRAAMALLTDQK